MTELTDKQKLALYKKSQTSGYSIDILEEIYFRGYDLWNESFSENPEQFAFDRVNSFIARGFAYELDADLLEGKRGLWDNIHAKRARIKAGSGERMRKPGEKGAPTAADLKASQNEEYTGAEKVSKNKNDPSSRFDGTTSLSSIYKKDTPGQVKETVEVIHTVKRVVSEATYKGRKVSLNKPFRTPGGPKKSAVYVDPDGDGKAKIVRFGDPNLSIKKDQPARKKSYCARSSGQGNLTKTDSANYWSRKAWDC